MSDSQKPPRECWIIKGEYHRDTEDEKIDPDAPFYSDICNENPDDDSYIHVIEKSAYDKLLARIEDLRRALMFYSDKRSWKDFATRVLEDCGETAIQALEQDEAAK